MITQEDIQEHRSCSICQEDFRLGEEYRRLPCLHISHTACIDEWLRRKELCPLCHHQCALTGRGLDRRLRNEWEPLDSRLRNEWEWLRGARFDSDGLLVQSNDLGAIPAVKMHLSVHLAGPEGSPYHGQVIELDVQLCMDFPYLPPRLRFVTPILHPNVSPWTDELAIGGEWHPAYLVYEVLLAVRRLLAEPDAENAANPEVASMYLHKRQEFLQMAHAWAHPSAEAHDSQLLAAAIAETSVSGLAILGQAADVLESAISAVGSDSTFSACDVAAILNELALQCPSLQGLLHAYKWDGCQLSQQQLLVPLHTALALELGREAPDSLGMGSPVCGLDGGETQELRGAGSAACDSDVMETPIA